MNPYVIELHAWHVIGNLFVAFMLGFGAWAILHGLLEIWRQRAASVEEKRANNRL